MTSYKASYQVIAQAETLLIYGIFLFLTGLAQIGVTIGYQYIIEKNNYNINFLNFLPKSFSMNDIHLWYIYPSAALVSNQQKKRTDNNGIVINRNPFSILIKHQKFLLFLTN
jgi:hypothetical protein